MVQLRSLGANTAVRRSQWQALGLSEESDAVTIVVSEETGIVSICQRGKIERNFDPESLKLRLGELFLQEPDEKPDPEQLGGENRLFSRFRPRGVRQQFDAQLLQRRENIVAAAAQVHALHRHGHQLRA